MKGSALLKVLLALLLIAAGFYLYISIQLGPYGKGGTAFIPKGSSAQQTAQILQDNGIIRNTWAFRGLARWRGVQAQL